MIRERMMHFLAMFKNLRVITYQKDLIMNQITIMYGVNYKMRVMLWMIRQDH
jgi:hypothetical protein